MNFHVTLENEENDEGGWVVAECPALPGCVSQGRDREEALANIKEAITAWLWAEDQKATAAIPKDEPPVLVAVS
jgi:predicted RNase H-like HicB family nuclease